jgi:hypothetical protein
MDITVVKEVAGVMVDTTIFEKKGMNYGRFGFRSKIRDIPVLGSFRCRFPPEMVYVDICGR